MDSEDMPKNNSKETNDWVITPGTNPEEIPDEATPSVENIPDVNETLITRNLEPQYIDPRVTWVKPPRRSGLASGLMWGIMIGVLMVGSMWYYLHQNTYNYQIRNSSSVLERPRDIKEILAKVEPATVAITENGGTKGGGGAGTGFIISSDGLVLTNNHVVAEGKNSLVVTLSDGRVIPAKLLGSDPVEDLAVLKIEGRDFPSVVIGSSNKMEVGDDVVAIGNALALEGGLSVTRGIVSGKDRTIDTELGTQLQGIIQTDAAINRGNSGGPLVNSKGEVIGINTAIADRSYAQNVGFAISIDRVKPIIDDLKKGNSRKIAFLGIQAQDVSTRMVAELNLKVSQGALVVAVTPDSPASKTDLSKNDVLTGIDGAKITSSADMVKAIRNKKPGDKVKITFNRNGKDKTVEVTLIERPN